MWRDAHQCCPGQRIRLNEAHQQRECDAPAPVTPLTSIMSPSETPEDPVSDHEKRDERAPPRPSLTPLGLLRLNKDDSREISPSVSVSKPFSFKGKHQDSHIDLAQSTLFIIISGFTSNCRVNQNEMIFREDYEKLPHEATTHAT